MATRRRINEPSALTPQRVTWGRSSTGVARAAEAHEVSVAGAGWPGTAPEALVAATPDATLAELRERLPTTAALSTLWLELDRMGLTFKKTVHADEQRRSDVAAARRRWTETLPLHDAAQYVFVDESGVTTDLYAGTRAVCGGRGSWITRRVASGRPIPSWPPCDPRH